MVSGKKCSQYCFSKWLLFLFVNYFPTPRKFITQESKIRKLKLKWGVPIVPDFCKNL